MSRRVELSFLYHTNTILPRSQTLRLAARRCQSSQARSDPLFDQDIDIDIDNSPTHHQPSFLKEKARYSSRYTLAPSASPNTVGTRISSTITASERRAFETILRFSPKQIEPSGLKERSPFVDAVDTDVENILDIFSTAIQGHHAEQNAATAGQRNHDAHPALVAEKEPTLRTAQQLTSNPVGPWVRQNEQSPSTPATLRGSKGPHETLQFAVPEQEFNVARVERSLDEIANALHFERFDDNIKAAVRERMFDISTALQAAAVSTGKPGDIAMWEVCEARIFPLADHFQPPPEKRLKTTGPPKFTFTRYHSDNPSELLESAERGPRASARSGPHTSSTPARLVQSHQQSTQAGSEPLDSLTTLHHVYPAALLLALRLYINHFPSSQLAHNLLPRIRSLGHTSYVLGASPQFYNSLMSLVWLTRSSLRQIDALLSEMERGGVELNEETYLVLRQIENERATDLRRLEDKPNALAGTRGGAWWKRHEQVFWFPRILDWLSVASKRLNMSEMAARGLE